MHYSHSRDTKKSWLVRLIIAINKTSFDISILTNPPYNMANHGGSKAHSTMSHTNSYEDSRDGNTDFDALFTRLANKAAQQLRMGNRSRASSPQRSLRSQDTRYIPDDSSVLAFEDHGPSDPTEQKELYALPPEVRMAQDELFRNMRFQDLRVSLTSSLLHLSC